MRQHVSPINKLPRIIVVIPIRSLCDYSVISGRFSSINAIGVSAPAKLTPKFVNTLRVRIGQTNKHWHDMRRWCDQRNPFGDLTILPSFTRAIG